jgi:hypothetical protein
MEDLTRGEEASSLRFRVSCAGRSIGGLVGLHFGFFSPESDGQTERRLEVLNADIVCLEGLRAVSKVPCSEYGNSVELQLLSG